MAPLYGTMSLKTQVWNNRWHLYWCF